MVLTQLTHKGAIRHADVGKDHGLKSTGLIIVLILLKRFGQIGGWNREEILLLLMPFDVLSYSVAATFYGIFWKIIPADPSGESWTVY